MLRFDFIVRFAIMHTSTHIGPSIVIGDDAAATVRFHCWIVVTVLASQCRNTIRPVCSIEFWLFVDFLRDVRWFYVYFSTFLYFSVFFLRFFDLFRISFSLFKHISFITKSIDDLNLSVWRLVYVLDRRRLNTTLIETPNYKLYKQSANDDDNDNDDDDDDKHLHSKTPITITATNKKSTDKNIE